MTQSSSKQQFRIGHVVAWQWQWWGGPLNPFWCVFSRVGRVNQLNKIRSFFSIFWRLLTLLLANPQWKLNHHPLNSGCAVIVLPFSTYSPSFPSLDNNRPRPSPESEITIERPKNGFNCWNNSYSGQRLLIGTLIGTMKVWCVCVGSPDCLACLITILSRRC